jgi:hypothetical protein
MLYKVSCEQSHRVIYVPVYKEDVVRLMEFIYHAYVFADIDKEIPVRLMKTFQKIVSLSSDADTIDLDSIVMTEEE